MQPLAKTRVALLVRLPLTRDDGYTNGYSSGVDGFSQGDNVETRAQLGALWRDVLELSEEQVAELEYHSDFFALGGDLVSAAVLMTRLQQLGGCAELSMEEIIDHSSFGEMVSALAKM